MAADRHGTAGEQDGTAAAPDRESAPAPVCELAPDGDAAVRGLTHDPAASGPRADCVLCGEPTEYPADHPGSTLCPVCTWQQAQRIACSG